MTINNQRANKPNQNQPEQHSGEGKCPPQRPLRQAILHLKVTATKVQQVGAMVRLQQAETSQRIGYELGICAVSARNFEHREK